MMAKRVSDAEWRGDLKDGAGTLKLGSGAFEGRYSFKSRFEDGPGKRRDEWNVDVVFRFARDSPLEGDGFEPSVPLGEPSRFMR
jgi:hypothetical protein